MTKPTTNHLKVVCGQVVGDKVRDPLTKLIFLAKVK